MLSRLQGARRKTYLFLTTSERDRRNRRDLVMSQQRVHRRERDRVQQTNDLFHKAGHRDELTSAEAVTLQFTQMAWSFLILPAVFMAGMILLVFFSGRQKRAATRLEQRQAYTHRLEDAKARREALTLELDAARNTLREERQRRAEAEEALEADVARLTATLQELTALSKK